MKHIIILGDGMADHAVARLGGKTLLQYAHIPAMDRVAREGICGTLITIPEGFQPGSEVANTAILGYDLNKVYEGRGPLEAASIGYELAPGELAMRCNIIALEDGVILNHHGHHLTSEQTKPMIDLLNDTAADMGLAHKVKFVHGIQYRHLLVIQGGDKHIECAPPHDNPGKPWRDLLVRPDDATDKAQSDTASLLNRLILASQQVLPPGLSIWPWSPGYRPSMPTLQDIYPEIKSGAVISAVDLIRGIGHYAGLEIIKVDGATGDANTNYEGKAKAAIDALKKHDFVFLHIEASDEAGHDGDLQLKLRTITDLDHRVVGPIIEELSKWSEPVSLALLPDHPTPVEMRTHQAEPVPFAFWANDGSIKPDKVTTYDEQACAQGECGHLRLQEFMRKFMQP